jgi:hypothetical protein
MDGAAHDGGPRGLGVDGRLQVSDPAPKYRRIAGNEAAAVSLIGDGLDALTDCEPVQRSQGFVPIGLQSGEVEGREGGVHAPEDYSGRILISASFENILGGGGV